jgi:hypothetical protein
MKTRLYAAALVAGAALVLAIPARALMIAPPPNKLKFAVADAIVVGKVTEIAAKTVKAELYKGDTRELKVATVKVESSPLGKVGTTVKVGFFENKPVGPGGGPGIGRPIRPMPSAKLNKGDEALLILKKHPKEKGLYVLANYYDVIGKKDNPNFKKEIEEAKKTAKVLTGPQTALKAKSAEDRLTAAAILINRYKTPAFGSTKTEEVPAAESKLILTTLAEANWDERGGRGRDFNLAPQSLFFRLNLTEKDGWKQPRDFRTIATEAKKWLKDNAGKHKMTRYVHEKPVVQTSAEPE